MVSHLENPKDFTHKKLLELIKSAKLQGTRSTCKRLVVLEYTSNEQSEEKIKMVVEEDLTWGSEHTIQYVDVVL